MFCFDRKNVELHYYFSKAMLLNDIQKQLNELLLEWIMNSKILWLGPVICNIVTILLNQQMFLFLCFPHPLTGSQAGMKYGAQSAPNPITPKCLFSIKGELNHQMKYDQTTLS